MSWVRCGQELQPHRFAAVASKMHQRFTNETSRKWLLR